VRRTIIEQKKLCRSHNPRRIGSGCINARRSSEEETRAPFKVRAPSRAAYSVFERSVERFAGARKRVKI